VRASEESCEREACKKKTEFIMCLSESVGERGKMAQAHTLTLDQGLTDPCELIDLVHGVVIPTITI
jgi:hypothetical protein